jgi:glycosyltransferase involved in cell wall biosynthesis
MSREGLELARVAKARGVPVVLSPICWFEPQALLALSGGLVPACRHWALWALRRLGRVAGDWRRRLIQLSDRLLPNSQREAEQLCRLFGVDPGRVRVVPNGVEERFSLVPRDLPRNRVLYVGRIEPRKNLLGLIEALRPMGLPLTVVGAVVPGHGAYAEACRNAGAGFTRWVPGLPHDDPRLEQFYARSRVLALPSWFETPGLVALEAALAGCAVVITPYGSSREYFGPRVHYARPNRPVEIRQGIQAAWDEGPNPELAKWVKERFLWNHVAKQTAEVYDEVVS